MQKDYKWLKTKSAAYSQTRLLVVIGAIVFCSACLFVYKNLQINTKQYIRTFLKSVNPEILQKIDMGQKEIYVFISPAVEVKLNDLSKLLGFNKFLSFNKVQRTFIGAYYDGNDPEIIEASKKLLAGFIPQVNESGFVQGYCLYPKDALVNKEEINSNK